MPLTTLPFALIAFSTCNTRVLTPKNNHGSAGPRSSSGLPFARQRPPLRLGNSGKKNRTQKLQPHTTLQPTEIQICSAVLPTRIVLWRGRSLNCTLPMPPTASTHPTTDVDGNPEGRGLCSAGPGPGGLWRQLDYSTNSAPWVEDIWTLRSIRQPTTQETDKHRHPRGARTEKINPRREATTTRLSS